MTCVLERRLPLAAEISVDRRPQSAGGEIVHLPVQENVHATASSP